jgi:hypothetical protein
MLPANRARMVKPGRLPPPDSAFGGFQMHRTILAAMVALETATAARAGSSDTFGDPTRNVLLSCIGHAPQADAACAALERALAARSPGLRVRRAAGPSGPRGPAELAVALLLDRVEPHLLEAHLEWRTAASGWQSGPPLQLTAAEVEIRPSMLDRLAADLLRITELPLDSGR